MLAVESPTADQAQIYELWGCQKDSVLCRKSLDMFDS